jgi:sulfide:quinone oxidoreductase
MAARPAAPSVPRTMPVSAAKHLLVAGGGPAALEGALAVQRLAGERVRITLLADRDTFDYRPLAVTEPFGLGAPQSFSLAALAADRAFALVRGTLMAVEAAAHRVRLDDGGALGYDALLLAVGARGEDAVPGAITFGGPGEVDRLRNALAGLYAGEPLRVAFVAPAETAWTLPLYELALLTARWADAHELALEPWLVTHEHRALGMFGPEASRAVAELLEQAGVRLWTDAFAEAVEDGRLWLSIEGGLPIDLAVALPRPAGCAVAGLPTDDRGFVAVDALGRVKGLTDVYAAGDMTTRPLKQGGLATQQADAAASAIAAWSGAPVMPEPYRPVLRGMLLTGERPRYLRRAAGASLATDDAPWWPPHKIAGRELAPYLAAHPELLVLPSNPVESRAS